MGDRTPQPERPADGSSAPPPPWPARPIVWIQVLIATVFLFIVGGFFRVWLGSGVGSGPAPQSQGLARLTILLSPGAPLATDTHAPALALSPRGDRLIYVARRRSETVLYDRPFDQLEASMIPGTEGASAPFLSLAGDWVGFFA